VPSVVKPLSKGRDSGRTRFALLTGALTALALPGIEENATRGAAVRQLRFVACRWDSEIPNPYTPTVCRAASASARSGSPLQLRPHTVPRGGSCRPNLDGKHGHWTSKNQLCPGPLCKRVGPNV